MEIRFGDKTLNTTEAFEDGLYMVMEELAEMIVSQNQTEKVKYIKASVSNIQDKSLGITIKFSDGGQDTVLDIQTDEDVCQSALKWHKSIMDSF